MFAFLYRHSPSPCTCSKHNVSLVILLCIECIALYCIECIALYIYFRCSVYRFDTTMTSKCTVMWQTWISVPRTNLLFCVRSSCTLYKYSISPLVLCQQGPLVTEHRELFLPLPLLTTPNTRGANNASDKFIDIFPLTWTIGDSLYSWHNSSWRSL